MNARAERFPLFDSVRGLAALMIVLLHAAIIGGALAPGAPGAAYVARLDVGVTIFFVASGFLLYRPFALALADGSAAPALFGYAWRRFLRIVPAYWVALTVLTLALGLHGVLTARGVPTFYGFGQIYSRGTAGMGITQAWTLCVEVSFYALLPLVALIARRLARLYGRAAEPWLVAALTAASVAFNAAIAFGGLAGAITYAPTPLLAALPGSFMFFGLGMLLAILTARPGRRLPAVRVVERWPGLAWAGALVAFLASAWAASDAPFAAFGAAGWMVHQILYGVAALLFVLPAVLGDPRRGPVRRVLGNRVLLYLGLISYSVYLWHLGVMLQLGKWGFARHLVVHPYVSWAVVGGLLTIVVASASYYVVERPALSLKRLVGRPAAGAPAAEALAEPADAPFRAPGSAATD